MLIWPPVDEWDTEPLEPVEEDEEWEWDGDE